MENGEGWEISVSDHDALIKELREKCDERVVNLLEVIMEKDAELVELRRELGL